MISKIVFRHFYYMHNTIPMLYSDCHHNTTYLPWRVYFSSNIGHVRVFWSSLFIGGMWDTIHLIYCSVIQLGWPTTTNGPIERVRQCWSSFRQVSVEGHPFSVYSTPHLISIAWNSWWIWYIIHVLHINMLRVSVMVFSATFNNISVILWRSILLMEETGVPRENHWHAATYQYN
jgi:hypothetical protein